MIFDITPIPKPRQTRADKWKKRPEVLRYRAFAQECKLKKVFVPVSGALITFHMPMPESWSKKKKAEMLGQPHQQKPDLDNMLKSLFDSVYEDDSCIWHVRDVKKVWACIGAIEIN